MRSSLSLLFLLLTLAIEIIGQNSLKFSINDFPSDFVFGAGTSALQVEGAAAEDGRTPTGWDIAPQGLVPDKSSPEIASDEYHKYKEDVKLMSDIGLEAYRFSISWSRLLPNGRGAINPKGLQYYNNLINELVGHGIQPHVTLYHLDLPQILEDEYGGWLSPKIVEDYTAYADVCFREFGDRVSHWTTLNEPNIMAIGSYNSGELPPNRCSYPGCIILREAGNSSTEPYIAVHHCLLAHASAVAIYRAKYQAKQKGWIGFNLYASWFSPFTNSTADLIATQRATDFFTGWTIDPLVFGDYPKTMKERVGSRIPSFTENESKLVKGSFDFIGLNHYFEIYVQDDSKNVKPGPRDFNGDMGVKYTVSKEDDPSSPFIPYSQQINPSALENLLAYIKSYYGNPPVYIQENGIGMPKNESLNDTTRINYISAYIEGTLNAIRNGSNTKGYFAWSFLDVFEVLSGYETRYGIVHVDFEDRDLKRQMKLSAHWYSNFLKKKRLEIMFTTLNETSYNLE